MHREIFNNNEVNDYVIFGAPLDIAIAANTKFDFIVGNKRLLSQPTSHGYKLHLILSMSIVQVQTERALNLQ